MNLHENEELFQDAVVATAQMLDIPEIFVEKDYWVTLVLHKIFHSSMAEAAVFKGGTALSKCHGLIERFSEDIDMVVLKNPGDSHSQLDRKVRKIGKVVESILPEIHIEGVTNKMGKIRKTAHQFEKVFSGDYGQVRPDIIVETTWFGNSEPNTEEDVSSYIAEMMHRQNQHDLIEEYGLQPFKVRVVSKEISLCEKIMSLVRFSRRENAYEDLANKIRHIYDIHMMLLDSEIEQFFKSQLFDKMLITVGKEDVESFNNNNEWLVEHPGKAVIFNQVQDTWNNIRSTYRGVFSELVIGKLPDDNEIISTLKRVSNRLNKVDWKLG
ncbi:MAG: nucleotidyl transferase AbiEii/AbiGii toxin family protein [Candidatus Marinimicrobia bacterium]|nr:nucleotidyl transferase AbiEii/AbiGii toxin family protein [Candidatus Neomarinimicrobiota bacterium]